MNRSPDIFQDLLRRLSGAEEPRQLLDRILDAAVGLTSATSGSIILIDRATAELSIEAARGLADRVVKATRLKVGKGITGWVAANGRTLRVADVRQDRRYVAVKKNIRSELAAPLLKNREVIGVINVDSTRVEAFSREDEAAIETLATLSSRVLADALVHDRLRKRSRLLEILVRIGGELTSTVSSAKILQDVTAAAAELTGARLVAVRLLDPAGEQLVLECCHGGSAEYARLAPVPVARSVLGGVARSQIPLIIEDVLQEPSYRFKAVARKEGLRSMLAVPLVAGGRALGALVIYRDRPGDFEEDAVTISVGLAGLAGAALENARLFKIVIDTDKRIRQSEMRSAAREMSAELAHQIRNPLTVVRLLVGGNRPGAALAETDREVVLKELDRVDALIARLLGNAAAEQARFEIFDLDALLDEIVAVSQVKAGARNIVVRKHGGAGRIRGDRGELWHAISNIVDNAVAAAERRVSIRVARPAGRGRDGARVELLFEDDGPGLPENVNVFEPLVTTKKDGVGIGLFSARRIVLEHGGELAGGRSRTLGGAAFRLSLKPDAREDEE